MSLPKKDNGVRKVSNRVNASSSQTQLTLLFANIGNRGAPIDEIIFFNDRFLFDVICIADKNPFTDLNSFSTNYHLSTNKDTCILSKRHLNSTHIKNTNIDHSTIIKLNSLKPALTIVCSYFRPRNIPFLTNNLKDIDHVLGTFESENLLFCGDVNGCHISWTTETDLRSHSNLEKSTRGDRIAKFFNSHGLTAQRPSNVSQLSTFKRSASNIDVLASSFPLSDVRIFELETSDHNGLVATFERFLAQTKNTNKINSKMLNYKMTQLGSDRTHINSCALTTDLLTAINESSFLSAVKFKQKHTSAENQKIKRDINVLSKMLRKATSPTYRKCLSERKFELFRRLHQINFTDKIRFFRSVIKTSSDIFKFTKNNDMFWSPESCVQTTKRDANLKSKLNDYIECSSNFALSLLKNDTVARNLNHPRTVSPTDIDFALKKLTKKQSRDIFGISMEQLSQLHSSNNMTITNIIDTIISNQRFPSHLKISRVSLIPKSCNEKYREISIISSLSKIAEFIINDRLVTCINLENNIHFSRQFGFIRGRSTEQMICQIIAHIRNTRQWALITADLESAFDQVIHDKIISNLIRLNVTPELTQLIRSYMSNRWSILIHENKYYCRYLSRGVQQGSILGPLLFIIAIMDITSIYYLPSDPRCNIYVYADDVILLFDKEHRHQKPFSHTIVTLLNKLSDDVKPFGLNCNENKINLLCPPASLPSFELNGKVVFRHQMLKVLGFNLSSRMTHYRHLDQLNLSLDGIDNWLTKNLFTLKFIDPILVIRATTSLYLNHIMYCSMAMLAICPINAFVDALLKLENRLRLKLKPILKVARTCNQRYIDLLTDDSGSITAQVMKRCIKLVETNPFYHNVCLPNLTMDICSTIKTERILDITYGPVNKPYHTVAINGTKTWCLLPNFAKFTLPEADPSCFHLAIRILQHLIQTRDELIFYSNITIEISAVSKHIKAKTQLVQTIINLTRKLENMISGKIYFSCSPWRLKMKNPLVVDDLPDDFIFNNQCSVNIEQQIRSLQRSSWSDINSTITTIFTDPSKFHAHQFPIRKTIKLLNCLGGTTGQAFTDNFTKSRHNCPTCQVPLTSAHLISTCSLTAGIRDNINFLKPLTSKNDINKLFQIIDNLIKHINEMKTFYKTITM